MSSRCPFALWNPLGTQTQPRMTGHDIVCLHTMVGYLISTDHYFSVSNGVGYIGTESHYGVGGKWGPDLGGGLDGAIWQWQDRGFTADANLDGRYRVISIETADNAPRYAKDIEPWTPKQVASLAKLIAWECSVAAHAACPSTWTCHKVGIPLQLIPDTQPGRRGIGYHRQGIDPWRVSGGVDWSGSYGKECPGDRRIAQIPGIITMAREGTTMDPEVIKKAVRDVLNEAVHPNLWNGVRYSIVSLLKSAHFYSIDGGWLGNRPTGVYAEDLVGEPTPLKVVLDTVQAQMAELNAIKAAIATLPQQDQDALLAKIAAITNRVAVADVSITLRDPNEAVQ